jgi:hypothetical protein
MEGRRLKLNEIWRFATLRRGVEERIVSDYLKRVDVTLSYEKNREIADRVGEDRKWHCATRDAVRRGLARAYGVGSWQNRRAYENLGPRYSEPLRIDAAVCAFLKENTGEIRAVDLYDRLYSGVQYMERPPYKKVVRRIYVMKKYGIVESHRQDRFVVVKIKEPKHCSP